MQLSTSCTSYPSALLIGKVLDCFLAGNDGVYNLLLHGDRGIYYGGVSFFALLTYDVFHEGWGGWEVVDYIMLDVVVLFDFLVYCYDGLVSVF